MKYFGTKNDKDLITKEDALSLMGDFGVSAEEKQALEILMNANMGWVVAPKLEVFGGASTEQSPHEINADTDVIFATNTSANAHLRLPANANNGKRIICKSLQGATTRSVTIYPPLDTDGKDTILIGYSDVQATTSAQKVMCSYYPTELICIIDGSKRYWLQNSRY